MIRRCALSAALSLSAAFASLPLHAQSAGATGTTVNGRVVVQVFVTLSDDQTMYHAVAGLPLGFVRSPRDTSIAVTDRAGSATILLAPGQYRLVSLAPTQWKGFRYSWNTSVVVKEDMEAIDLRRKEAMVSKIAYTVASVSNGETEPSKVEQVPARMAPQKAAAPAPAPVAAPAPVQPAAAAFVPVQMPEHVDAPAKAEAPKAEMAKAPAPAQRPMKERSRSKGFYMGLGAEANGLRVNQAGSSAQTGGGGGLVLGYGMSKRWSMYMDGSDAVMNGTGGTTYNLAHADLGLRMHFRGGAHRLVPFLQFGATERRFSTTSSGTTLTGLGVGGFAGAGLNLFLKPSVAMSSAVNWSMGNFDNFQVDNLVVGNVSVQAMTARVHLGLVWFP
jgi:hypothetical protein